MMRVQLTAHVRWGWWGHETLLNRRCHCGQRRAGGSAAIPIRAHSPSNAPYLAHTNNQVRRNDDESRKITTLLGAILANSTDR
jgi:hypothetical protein